MKGKTELCAEKEIKSALGNLGQCFPELLPEISTYLAAGKAPVGGRQAPLQEPREARSSWRVEMKMK